MVLTVDPDRAVVYEHGWQSWSPSTTYPVTGTGHRPRDAAAQLSGYRPYVRLPEQGFQGEGLLAVAPAPGEPVHVFSGRHGAAVPSIRARLIRADTLAVSADDQVDEHVLPGPMDAALGAWAERWAPAPRLRRAPTVWCSWYQYLRRVTEADILENLHAIGRHDLPVDVVQIDDGWQREIGDWSAAGLDALAATIRAEGRRAGIWLAPFLVGSRSALARRHPEWLGREAGEGWGQALRVLDISRPGAAEHLAGVFAALAGLGFDYFKLDFLYAGALDGLEVYQEGMRLIRRAVGPEPYLVGCGAPLLPSVGLVDAMRVGPDIAPHYEPLVPDMSSYSQRTATLTTAGRSWQHGRFWVNDPDCLLARPSVEHRERWADTIRRYGGLRASSDRIAELDAWGLETTRELLSDVPLPEPFQVV
uniref:glycoside hydrolase family 36 protein n=1 Tax=Nonomuraea bangladeshensis TaxID=404385 RepID=UPI003F4980BB